MYNKATTRQDNNQQNTMESQELKKFEEIVNQYQKSIINFHYRFTGDRFEAENLAQDTFIKAYLKFKTVKDYNKLKSWLFSIARNTVIDFFRKNKNREIAFGNEIIENFVETASISSHDQVEIDEISSEIRRCVDQLSTQDRMLIKLLYYDGFSYKEIGQLLRINPNTLKSRLHRARMTLLETIKASDSLRDMAVVQSR